MNKTTYQQEKDLQLQTLLETGIYPSLSKEGGPHSINLEFFVTPECNKDCTYCYLQKHKYELYSKECIDEDKIISNMVTMLDYLGEKTNYTIYRLDFFSGEIWHTDFGLRVLKTLTSYLETHKLHIQQIMIPTNGTFIKYDKMKKEIEKIIKRLDSVHTYFMFSFSVDGQVVEDEVRPFKDGTALTNDYYKNLLDFAEKYNYCFHPMVAAQSIEKWCDNFRWWESVCIERDWNFFDRVMMLEVRDANSWSDEKIEKYLDFLTLCWKKLKLSYTSEGLFIKDLTGYINDDESIMRNMTYYPIDIRKSYMISCSATQMFAIRLGDLAIIPCHRLSYPNFIYGQYKLENDKIIGVTGHNIQNAIGHYLVGQQGYIGCDRCPIKTICLKGCHGAQFEYHKEHLTPIPSVCRLQKVKVLFTIVKILELRDVVSESEVQQELNKLEVMKDCLYKEDKEFVNKWMQKIQALQ